MNVSALFDLLAAAKAECGHSDYVVVGSVSVLGMSEVCAIPAGMTVSIDADCYTLAEPPRVFDLQAKLGEGSAYHHLHGIYLDPVSPKLPTLPDGWQQRLIRIARSGVTAHFLEPNDAAVSKLARAEPRDLRWVRAGLEAGLVSLPMLKLRMRCTDFLDSEEQAAALGALDTLALPSNETER
jgi:hypothetical protein